MLNLAAKKCDLDPKPWTNTIICMCLVLQISVSVSYLFNPKLVWLTLKH